MKIVDETHRTKQVDLCKVKDGTAFFAKIGGHPRMLCVKAYRSCIGLENPGDHMWAVEDKFMVEDYQEAEVVVTVKKLL